jgi:hypothetical protein
MKQKTDWDYALRIKGTSPRSIPLSVLAEYIKEFAGLLGEQNKPTYAGVIKGSALLRAKISDFSKTETKVRLASIRLGEGTGNQYAENITRLVTRENTSAELEDKTGAVILSFYGKGQETTPSTEYVIQDTGTMDGTVVGITGIDDTVHIKLQSANGQTDKVTVRDLSMAKKLAHYFRGNPIRINVHGTWKRSAVGIWEPLNVYGDSFEELDSKSAQEIFEELSEVPGNVWQTMNDPMGFWKELRGID